MKQELLNSVLVALNSLDGVHVHGKDNVLRMRDAFVVLDGMRQYISNMPDEESDERPD